MKKSKVTKGYRSIKIKTSTGVLASATIFGGKNPSKNNIDAMKVLAEFAYMELEKLPINKQ